MKLTVTTSSLNTSTYELESSDKVMLLKQKIHQAHPEWPIMCMKVVHEDIVLHDEANLNDYNLPNNPVVRLVLRSIALPLPSIDPQLERWYVNKQESNKNMNII